MNSTTASHAVRLERTIPASPAEVYRAWLDPDLLRRWLAPGEFRPTRVEVDERVGGHFRVWHGSDESDAGGFECEIIELVPAQRIAFRWGFVGPQRTRGPVFDSLLTISLRESPNGGTELTLTHERLEELAAAMPSVAEHVGPGWVDALTKLAATLRAGHVREG